MARKTATTLIGGRILQHLESYSVANGYVDTVLDQGSAFRNGRYLNKTWTVTPNYGTLRAQKKRLPENPFNVEGWAITGGGGIYRTRQEPAPPNGWTRQYWEIPAGTCALVPQPMGYDLTVSDVAGKLLQKAKQSTWNAPIFLLEAGKTVRMVGETAAHLATMMFQLRRGKFGAFLQSFHSSVNPLRPRQWRRAERDFNREYGRDPKRAAADAWLQYRYGWTPFVKDVQDASTLLMDLAESGETPLDGSVYASTYKVTKDDYLDTPFTPEPYRVYGDHRVTTIERLRVTWRYRIKPESIPARLGLLNPLEVLWELLPLSFVVDWFAPVGTYLRSLGSSLSFAHLGGSVGRKVTASSVSTPTRSGDRTASFEGLNASCEYTAVQRSALASIPEVRLSSLVPKFDLGIAQMTSSLALLQQAFKGIR